LDLKNLQVIPDAPRTATIFPPAWDWRLLNNMTYDFGPISVDSNMKYNEEKPPERAKVVVSILNSILDSFNILFSGAGGVVGVNLSEFISEL
jgi:hypothetical protein